MLIKEYFDFYEQHKKTDGKLKKFSLIDKKLSIVTFFKRNKKNLIKNINFMYFDSDEEYLMQVYNSDKANLIFINTRLTKDVLSIFTNKQEYENYLTIYGTFCILLNQDLKITSLSDTRIPVFIRDFLKDLTYFIFYCDDFHLNLQDFVHDNFTLRMIYKYGYDLLFNIFLAFDDGRINDRDVVLFFENEILEENSLRGLYNSFLPNIKGF
ncbi:hypothetical protein [Campylobacter sp. RM16187]|uniref:hypothetical protein n=1 Tax=Campylobacter sp. RM16187 TaxID=1660063 RepID=UPI0021B511E0|nr:hypothetical protein [Campylobacter sp. RM16187]QKG30281.1 hypothetical protein CDOMF_a032 [Campylobacter sp. RM16187]